MRTDRTNEAVKDRETVKDRTNEVIDGYTTLKIGRRYYDALGVYAEAKGMTVEEVFAKAIKDYIIGHFTDIKDVPLGNNQVNKGEKNV